MSRYFSRLMSQTGLNIPAATNTISAASPQPLSTTVAPPTLSSAAELTEQEIQSESPASSSPPAASVHGTTPSPPTNGGQTGPEQPDRDRRATETRLKAAPAARDSQEAESSLPSATRTRAPTAGIPSTPVASPSTAPPSAGEVVAPALTSRAIIQNVMAWVAEGSRAPERPTPTEARATGLATQAATVPVQVATAVTPEPADFDVESAPPIRSPASRLSIPESSVRRRSSALPAPAAEPRDNAGSVHIGAIHLTLEVPPAKPGPQPAPPRPVPSTHAPAMRSGSSRLSRYYLRPC